MNLRWSKQKAQEPLSPSPKVSFRKFQNNTFFLLRNGSWFPGLINPFLYRQIWIVIKLWMREQAEFANYIAALQFPRNFTLCNWRKRNLCLHKNIITYLLNIFGTVISRPQKYCKLKMDPSFLVRGQKPFQITFGFPNYPNFSPFWNLGYSLIILGAWPYE